MKKKILTFMAIAIFNPIFGQGNCLNFDGSDDYVDIGNAINGVRTIEMWFKSDVDIYANSTSNYVTLIGRNTSDNTREYGLVFEPTSGNLLFYNNGTTLGSTHIVYSDATSWTAGVWYHVAATVDATNGMKMYINGIQNTGTNAYTGSISSSGNITALGRWGDYTGNRYFNGSIDEVRLWSVAQSSAAINANMKSELPSTQWTNLIAYYEYNQGIPAGGNSTETSLTNVISGSYTGTLTNFGLSGNSSNWLCSNAFADMDFSNCLNFDGSDDYVDIGTSIGNSNLRTIEMWFKSDVNINSTSHSDYTALIARNTSDNTCEYGLVFEPTTGKMLFYNNESTSPLVTHNIYSDKNSWTAGSWYHVAAIINSTSGMKMYINGVLQDQNTDLSTPNFDAYTSPPCSSSLLTALGNWGDYNKDNSGYRHFDGSIDELRIWSTARTSGEINSNMYHELVGTETNLIDYYNFNEGISNGSNSSITSLTNIVSGIYTGTLTNFGLSGNSSNWICSDVYVGARKGKTSLLLTEKALQYGEVNIFPNPANDLLTIENTGMDEIYNIQIIDITGRVIFNNQFNKNSNQINIKDLSQGVYILQTTSNNKIYKNKFVKN